MISLCTCWRLRFTYNSVLYQWPNQRIEWTPSCTRLRLAFWLTHIHKGTFSPEQGSNEGITIDDRWFLQLVSLPNSKRQYIFLKKEILLKTILTVHRFGICSSVWCRAEIFDLDQAAFRSSCPHCSFMYESFPTETTLWNLKPPQTRATCASAQSMYRGGLICVYAYRRQNALCQEAV